MELTPGPKRIIPTAETNPTTSASSAAASARRGRSLGLRAVFTKPIAATMSSATGASNGRRRIAT
jgi:hypothetical protein